MRRNGDLTNSWRRRSPFILMNSMIRLRRSTSRRCPGSFLSLTTPPTSSICSRSGMATGTPSIRLNKKQTDLSDQLVAAWTNFAWTGNPNGLGNFPWPRHTTGTIKPAWLIEDLPVLSTLTDPQYGALRKCDFWDAVAASATSN